MEYTLINSIQVGDYVQTNFTGEKWLKVTKIYYGYVIGTYDHCWNYDKPYFLDDKYLNRLCVENGMGLVSIKIDEITAASYKFKTYFMNGKMYEKQVLYDRATGHKLSQSIGRNLHVKPITNSKKYNVYTKYNNEIKNAQPQQDNEEYYGIIYIVMNKINKKMYIGQTKNTFKKRYNGSIMNTHNTELLADLKKYGLDNFIINEEYCRCNTKAELDKKERQLIKLFNTDNYKYGYNKTGGNGYCYTKYLNYERIASLQNVNVETIIKLNEEDYEGFMIELEKELEELTKNL